MPAEIQRSRVKGWRMPPGAIYVGRPSVWGNPFGFVARTAGVNLALALYRELVHGCWNPTLIPKDWPNWYVHDVFEAHHAWVARLGEHPSERARVELRGHDLACWCPLGAPCHRTILLDIANRCE